MSDKIGIFRHLSEFSKRHFEGIDMESPERVAQLLREAKDLYSSLNASPGDLDSDSRVTLVGIMSVWDSVQRDRRISDEAVTAASMPFTTLTGRPTADPVFRQRCDM